MVSRKMLDRYATMSKPGYPATPASGGVNVLIRRLLTPEAGLLGQGVRYVVGGCASAGVYMLSTTVFALAVGLPFEAALAIGFGLMIAVNFTLHRTFVWVNRDGFALPLHRQFRRYVAVAGGQYGLTAASIAVLPRAIGLPTEVVYLFTAVAFAVVSFVAYRQGVFHPRQSGQIREPVR